MFSPFFFAVFRYTVFPSSIPVLSFDTAVSGNTGIPPKPRLDKLDLAILFE